MKRKTTSTAKVTNTSGKTKTLMLKFAKNIHLNQARSEQIKAEALAKAQAEQNSRANVQKAAMVEPKLKQPLSK